MILYPRFVLGKDERAVYFTNHIYERKLAPGYVSAQKESPMGHMSW